MPTAPLNGLRFARRVLVCTAAGLYVYRTHAEDARLMCATQIAKPERAKGKIDRIVLCRIASTSAVRDGAPITDEQRLQRMMGQRYVYKERLSPDNYRGRWVYRLRKLQSLPSFV